MGLHLKRRCTPWNACKRWTASSITTQPCFRSTSSCLKSKRNCVLTLTRMPTSLLTRREMVLMAVMKARLKQQPQRAPMPVQASTATQLLCDVQLDAVHWHP